MAAFIETPFFPDVSQLRVDRITALLALLLEDPLRSTSIGLIYKSYSKEDAEIIWSQWASYLQVPRSHPLAGDGLARDRIITMLQTYYTTPEQTAADAQALTEFVSVAIPVETLIFFTTITI